MTEEEHAMRLAAAEQIGKALAAYREATGEHLRTGPDVARATYTDLQRMAGQAAAYLAAFELIRTWMAATPERRLGDALKVVPADVADELEIRLRRAGVWP